jgi:hypothetical protein
MFRHIFNLIRGRKMQKIQLEIDGALLADLVSVADGREMKVSDVIAEGMADYVQAHYAELARQSQQEFDEQEKADIVAKGEGGTPAAPGSETATASTGGEAAAVISAPAGTERIEKPAPRNPVVL